MINSSLDSAALLICSKSSLDITCSPIIDFSIVLLRLVTEPNSLPLSVTQTAYSDVSAFCPSFLTI